MDVFALTPEAEAFFAAAAFRAAEELGVLDAPPPAHPSRRLAILLEALGRARRPAGVPVPREGWGRLAEVIRTDRPLPLPDDAGAFQAHLAAVGLEPARRLAGRLHAWAEPKRLLDLGGGLGTYARAFVERGGTAVVVDRVARAAEPGLEFVAEDLFEVERAGFGVVLLCNVLHLYGPEECARLCARARRLGRIVVVKDLERDSAAGAWFSLNMALYTERGEVHPTARLVEWLGGECEVERMGDHVVVKSRPATGTHEGGIPA